MSQTKTETLTQEFEYLKVEVLRKESTDVFMKVPKGWRPTSCNSKMLGVAAKQTTQNCDWDNMGWEEDVELIGFEVVDEYEANHFLTYAVKI